MKTIDTLVDDINTVLITPTVVPSDVAESFGRAVSDIIVRRLAQEEREPTLRMSNIGSSCERKLYYHVNEPGSAEPLTAAIRLKFAYGDILEALLLFLAKSAGHEVLGEQDELEINGIKGHRDAIIDGITVDCKSASSRSFDKFVEGIKPETDSFGYLDQLNAYVFASSDAVDPSRGAFLAIDKQFGRIALDVHEYNGVDYDQVVERKKQIVAAPKPPARPFFDEADGAKGNRKLGTVCSYCNFKNHCWPGLRAFAYASGPRYLTKVVELPKVPEIIDETRND